MSNTPVSAATVLIVDDEELTRELIGLILKEDGYQLTFAGSALQAIALLEDRSFDVVLTDKNMPDGTGLQVAARVRALEHDSEIIMMSAYASLESAVEAMKLGVADYIQKPFADTELIRRSVARALELINLRRANLNLVTELRTKNEELEALATRDPLTKLFNHAYFQQALDREIVRSHRNEEEFGLLFIDLDDFKSVNDTHGHLTGDKLLAGFAALLQGEVRRSDMSFRLRAQDIAARYGGDEFAIILPQTPKHGAATKAERLRELMEEHSAGLLDLPVQQTLSIGVAAYPIDATERTKLIDIADRCLYAAKRAGRNRIVACSESVLQENTTTGSAALMSAELISSLERSLEEESFDFVYQPVVTAEDGRVVGYEALCRPRDPVFANPIEFLAAAETCGKVGRLGRILRRVAVTALDELDDDLLLFINLHPQEINDPELCALDEVVQRHAHQVVFELTNTHRIKNQVHVRGVLKKLRETGLRVSLDDLGSDYMGLNTLASLEPDFARIHRGLVKGSLSDKRLERLVRHVIEFANGEGIQVIAEGIETEAERDSVVELGASLLQGYLFGRPVPLDRLPSR